MRKHVASIETVEPAPPSGVVCNCAIPEQFYLFTNRNRFGLPPTASEGTSYVSAAYAACQTSEEFAAKYRDGGANYLPYLPEKPDLPQIPQHIMSIGTDMRVEYDAENIRLKYFPFAPSRVSALFAFGDEDSCKRANDYFAWDIKRVMRARLSLDPYVRVWRVNMEIVSILRELYATTSAPESFSDLWRSYWAGEGNVSVRLPREIERGGRRTVTSGVLWQYLVEGRLDIIG